jgi:hypothetical protein
MWKLEEMEDGTKIILRKFILNNEQYDESREHKKLFKYMKKRFNSSLSDRQFERAHEEEDYIANLIIEEYSDVFKGNCNLSIDEFIKLELSLMLSYLREQGSGLVLNSDGFGLFDSGEASFTVEFRNVFFSGEDALKIVTVNGAGSCPIYSKRKPFGGFSIKIEGESSVESNCSWAELVEQYKKF